VFLKGPRAALWALVMTLLSTGINLLSSAVYLPGVTILMQSFVCTNTTTTFIDPSVPCWTGGHIAMMVFAVVFIIIFSIVSLRLLRVGGDATQIVNATRYNFWDYRLDNAVQWYSYQPLNPPLSSNITVLCISPLLAKLVLRIVTIANANALDVAIIAFVIGLIQLLITAIYPGARGDGLNALLLGTQMAVTWSYLIAMVGAAVSTAPLALFTIGLPVGVVLLTVAPVAFVTLRSLASGPRRRGAQLEAVAARA